MSRHGTESAYTQGCHCAACRQAASQARALRRAGAGPGSIPKGQQSHGAAYDNHGCRCDVCRAWKRETNRRYQQKKRAAA